MRLCVVSTSAAAISGVVPPNNEVEMLYVMDNAPARTRVGNSVGGVPGSVLSKQRYMRPMSSVPRNTATSVRCWMIRKAGTERTTSRTQPVIMTGRRPMW
ncbi:hypothetical protein [Micromonospora sp. NPDC005367]|uniref:hypothetical protein n=1 Tax=Micromonospora sp. NPDC005367 TaxID=3155590 RepID=UPI0033B50B3E